MEASEEPNVDGPAYGAHVLHLFLRTALLFVILPVGLMGAFGVADYASGTRFVRAFEPALVTGGVCVGLVAFLCVLLPSHAHNLRARRDLLLARSARWAGRLAWSANYLAGPGSQGGSLHVVGGCVSFLWHQPATPTGAIHLEMELSLRLDAEQVAAVEVVPPTSIQHWLRYGSKQVVLLLRDGRSLRFAAPSPKLLAERLREALARPSGSPVAANLRSALDEAKPEDVGEALGRRFETVVLIVRDETLATPRVVLRGPTEELHGVLTRALAAVDAEGEELEPYLLARKPPEAVSAREGAKDESPGAAADPDAGP